MKKMLLLALVLAFTVPIATVAQDAMAEDVPQAFLNFFIGDWETEYEFPGYGKVREKATYEWGESKHEIIGSVTVYSNGEVVEETTGRFWYDPASATFYAESSSNDGSGKSTAESLEWTEELIVMEGMMEEGPFNLHRFSMHLTDENTLDVYMNIPEGDGWKELMHITYKRVTE